MARTIARLQVAALEDPDFQVLTINAQWTYWVILQQPRLTLAGSIDLHPGRWSNAATDSTVDQILTGITELEDHRYVIIDRDTEELLVRTFVRHDLDTSRLSRNTIKGFWNAWEGIYSADLRAAVITEIDPSLWDKLDPFAPVEADTIRNNPPTPTGTPTPVHTGEATPVQTGTNQKTGKPQKPRSHPFEPEPPPPFELPVHCPLPTTATYVSSPTGLGTARDPTTDDDDQPTNPIPTPETVAQARSQRLGGHHSPAWIRAVALGLDEHRLADLGRAGHTATEIDLILDGRPPTETTSQTEPAPTHPAIHATTTRSDCPDCAGGMTLDDTGTARPCPTCNPDDLT